VGIDRYILTLAQYTYFNGLSGGLDANLNQSLTTGTDSTNVLQKGTQSVANATTSLPYLSFEGYANGGTFTFTYDEVRLSDTGFNALPVPEPSGALLFAMAAGAWFARQRRRLVRLS
jgi:hypothetical protein